MLAVFGKPKQEVLNSPLSPSKRKLNETPEDEVRCRVQVPDRLLGYPAETPRWFPCLLAALPSLQTFVASLLDNLYSSLPRRQRALVNEETWGGAGLGYVVDCARSQGHSCLNPTLSQQLS